MTLVEDVLANAIWDYFHLNRFKVPEKFPIVYVDDELNVEDAALFILARLHAAGFDNIKI